MSNDEFLRGGRGPRGVRNVSNEGRTQADQADVVDAAELVSDTDGTLTSMDGEFRTYTEMPGGPWYIEDVGGERCIAVAEGLGKASERFGTFYRRGGVLGRVMSSGWHKLNSPQMPLVASRFEAAANLWAWARNQQHPRFRIVEGTLPEGHCCPRPKKTK